ncbi:MAG: methyltransferase [Myxococcales bacterium]|nr:methyltransferase [Myxococcales bacterium]
MNRPRHAPLDLNPAFVSRVADVFAAVEYSEATIRDYLAPKVELVPVEAMTTPRFVHALSEDVALDVFLRLYAFGVTASEDAVRRAIAPMSIAEWVDGGLLARAPDGRLYSPICLAPQRGVLVAYDRVEEGIARPSDYVMGVATTTAGLLDAVPHRPFGRALDLGTGCGATALVRAAHCGHVVATDLLERSICYTRFNALLNACDNVTAAAGDMLAPVAGQTFDLVTMNAPHVITPEGGLAYRDGGMAGESFVRRVARELPSAIADGGFGQFTLQWLEYEGVEFGDRLSEWFDNAGCDVWVMRTRYQSPASHAEKFIRELEVHTPQSYAARVEEWLSWFDAQNVTGIGAGVVSLRRRSGRNWFRSSEADDVDSGGGAAILRGFAYRDAMQNATGDSLLDTAFRASPDVELHTTGATRGNGWLTSHLELRIRRGLRTRMQVDPATAQVLASCDGSRTLRAIADGIARGHGAAPEQVYGGVLTAAQALLERDALWFPG